MLALVCCLISLSDWIHDNHIIVINLVIKIRIAALDVVWGGKVWSKLCPPYQIILFAMVANLSGTWYMLPEWYLVLFLLFKPEWYFSLLVKPEWYLLME